MSCDVSINEFSRNYTSNVSKLWYDHILDTGKGGGLRELHGMTGHEALIILSEAFDGMSRTRGYLGEKGSSLERAYDCESGWGSAIGAVLFMGEIMGACAKYPYDIVDVST